MSPGALALPQATLGGQPPITYTEAGAGEIVLLIHGSLCDHRYWRWQLAQLAGPWRLVAPSLAGCWPDDSAHPHPGYSIAGHAADMARLARALGGGRPVHVVGHSRGAHVALDFALQAPDLIRSLTLADPGFRFTHEPPAPPFYAQAVERLQAGDAEAAIAQFIDTVNGDGTWRRMVGWFKQMVRDNAATLLSQVREAGLAVSLDDVARLRCPVMLVGGVESPARYGSRQDQIQSVLPRARRSVIRLAAHGMNLANPRAFNRSCHEFFVAASAGQAA